MTRHNPRSSSEAVAHKTRRGFNLIEAAIVLAVVGGVIGGIWVAASSIKNKLDINKMDISINNTASGAINLLYRFPISGVKQYITTELLEAGIIQNDVPVISVTARLTDTINFSVYTRYISNERRLVFEVSSSVDECIGFLKSQIAARKQIGRIMFSDYGGGDYSWLSVSQYYNLQNFTTDKAIQECESTSGYFNIVYFIP